MKNMFFNPAKLKSIIFGNIQTSKVKNMSGMFQNCKALISLDLSNFIFYSITDMTNMFSGCENLQSNFQIKNILAIIYIWIKCSVIV